MKKNLSAQNLILIASGEDPDDFANWDGTGWGVPPLGTSPTGVTSATLDNSLTPGDNTPDVPTFEIVRGKASLQYTTDEDNKESMDVSTREVEYDPGKTKIEIGLDIWEERGTSRHGGARAFNFTNREYRPSQYYPKFAMMAIAHPKDATGGYLTVNDLMDKSTIISSEKVILLWDVNFKSKNPNHEPGEKIRFSLPGNAAGKREFVNYVFNLELAAAIAISGVGTDNLTTQPKLPTRLQIVVTSWSADGAGVNIVGKNWRGEAITENFAPGADGTFYTEHFFKSVDTGGVQGTLLATMTLEINANELI